MADLDLSNYGPMQECAETDMQFRVRKDGDFVMFFGVNGEPRDGFRREDIAGVLDAMEAQKE